MSAPAALYVGRIMHARLGSIPHRFSYRVLAVLLDLQQLDAGAQMARAFSVDRFNLLSVRRRDHGPRDRQDPQALLGAVRELVEEHGAAAGGRMQMLAFPRVLGSVFNPLTVYFVEDTGGAPSAIVYEVRNTFGGMHHYVCPVGADGMTPAGLRHSAHKAFYVSPFLDMNQRYDFRVKMPGDTASVRILQHGADGPSLSASFFGEHLAMSDRNIWLALKTTRMSSLKVLGGIHYEAARLFGKGARFHAEPKEPRAVRASAGSPNLKAPKQISRQ